MVEGDAAAKARKPGENAAVKPNENAGLLARIVGRAKQADALSVKLAVSGVLIAILFTTLTDMDWDTTPPLDTSVDLPDLMKWLRDNGASVKKVGVHDFGGERGRGLMATRNIKAGDIVLEIPSTLHLNCHSRGGEAFKDLIPDWVPAPDWWCIVLRLLAERANETSFWAPYIWTLPARVNSLWTWTEAEIAELQLPLVAARVKRKLETLGRFYEEVIKPNVKGATEREALWAASIVDSRTWGALGLVPLADMPNHDASRGSPLESKYGGMWRRSAAEKASLVVVAYSAQKSGAEFLESYGFVPSLEQDAVEYFTLLDPAALENGDALLAALAARDVGEATRTGMRKIRVLLRLGDVPHQLLQFARAASPGGLSPPPKGERPPEGYLHQEGFISRENERLALRAIKSTVQRLLDAFPEDAAADRALLEQGGLAGNRRLAVRARLQVKEICASVVRRVHELLSMVAAD
eukprot:tig00000367_g24490.t1